MRFLLILATSIVSAISLISCNKQQIEPNPASTATASSLTTATAKAVGSWQLIAMLSGWTGRSTLVLQNIELVIDDKLQAVYYENGKEVSRFKYRLKATDSGIRYSIVDQVGKPTFYIQSEGILRVNDQNLIIGDTYVDGTDYTFNRK